MRSHRLPLGDIGRPEFLRGDRVSCSPLDGVLVDLRYAEAVIFVHRLRERARRTDLITQI